MSPQKNRSAARTRLSGSRTRVCRDLFAWNDQTRKHGSLSVVWPSIGPFSSPVANRPPRTQDGRLRRSSESNDLSGGNKLDSRLSLACRGGALMIDR